MGVVNRKRLYKIYRNKLRVDCLLNYSFNNMEVKNFQLLVKEKRVEKPISYNLIIFDTCLLVIAKSTNLLIDKKSLIEFLVL